jgi:hypothetical protein
MNGIAASLLLNLTSSVRFEGSLNVDLNDITMNLVPFPRVRRVRVGGGVETCAGGCGLG